MLEGGEFHIHSQEKERRTFGMHRVVDILATGWVNTEDSVSLSEVSTLQSIMLWNLPFRSLVGQQCQSTGTKGNQVDLVFFEQT